MNNKQVVGLAVISIADGAKLGTIDRVFADPSAMRIVGFSVKPTSGLLPNETANLLDVDDVHAVGHDAITLNDTNAIRGDRVNAMMDSLIEFNDLEGKKVVTQGGTYVGNVASLEFDEHSFGLTQVEVSPGFFKSNKHVTTDQVVSVGEMVIVDDAVCGPDVAEVEVDADADADRRFVVGDVTPAS